MKIAITLLLYTLAYGWGWRKLRGEGHRRRRLLLGCIMGYGVYLNLCGITDTPHISLGLLYTAYFQPVGRAVINWLGG